MDTAKQSNGWQLIKFLYLIHQVFAQIRPLVGDGELIGRLMYLTSTGDVSQHWSSYNDVVTSTESCSGGEVVNGEDDDDGDENVQDLQD